MCKTEKKHCKTQVKYVLTLSSQAPFMHPSISYEQKYQGTVGIMLWVQAIKKLHDCSLLLPSFASAYCIPWCIAVPV